MHDVSTNIEKCKILKAVKLYAIFFEEQPFFSNLFSQKMKNAITRPYD